MTDDKQFAQWIDEFEREGEQAVRDSINFKGGMVTGGEGKLSTAREWLRAREKSREDEAFERRKREQEETIERKQYEKTNLDYVRWTFWAAVVGAFLSAFAVIIALFH